MVEEIKGPVGRPATAVGAPQQNPDLIRVFDAYGREMQITREQWRSNVLPGTLKTNWNDPDKLYGIIVQALNDGFRTDVVAAAEQLYRIDPQHARAACVWGIVLMQEGRLDQGEKIFKDFIAKHGEDGSVLTNLAKVYSGQGLETKADETLWRALECDPNQDNGLGWFWARSRDRGGEQAGFDSLRRLAAVPGSWRAQLWLARSDLQAGRLDQALRLYRQCFDHAAKPVPTDLLMQISGDLGNAVRVSDILELCAPHFSPDIHGLNAGNNLMKAYLMAGQPDAASRILNALYGQKRPDWQQTLAFWDTEIAKSRLAGRAVPDNPMTMTMLFIDGPVWLKPDSPGSELFPPKASDAASICFLGSSAELANPPQQIERQLPDAAGRLSRAIPLFLAEHIDLHSAARGRALLPWVTQKGGAGFVLSGVPWADQDAVEHARQNKPTTDYVVTAHLKCQTETWTLAARLLRVSDGNCLGHLSAAFAPSAPEAAVPQIGRDLLAMLAERCGIEMATAAPIYQVPGGTQFPYYLLRLEQLLAVRCAALAGVPANYLNGEREIIGGNLQLCLGCPANVTARLLLAKTVLAMKTVRPDVLPEFRDQLTSLQRDHPLPQPAQGVVQSILDQAFVA